MLKISIALCLLLSARILALPSPPRQLQGMPVQIKAYFAGQYQNPTMRLELGENFKVATTRDPLYKIDPKSQKITVPSVKVHEVFKIKSPSVSVKGKLRGKGAMRRLLTGKI